MGPVDHLEIVGAKGGESQPKQAVESPDSLRSTNIAKILLAVGEGEFDGVPTDRDIYLDNTPIADASGNVNFPGVKWEWRPGSVEQSYIQGIPSVENETSVNVELRSDNPFTRALSNTQLSAVRVRMSWPRLAKQESNGDTRGYRIEYAIDIATDGGAYVEAHLGAVDGKSTNGYQRSVRVNLPKATSGWMLRVRRLTPNANSGTVADTMTVAGYTEIIDQKIRYPNTALLYIEFDAQQFQNIPAVTVKCKAKRWPVPSTYDPITRTYSGVWDGTFKLAWTNNPAFVTYGLCVEDRFGLGKRIKPWMVDKWEMYRIAQYCDQLVPDGVGGQEPRFLCDMNLQGRAEAWTLLRDLSAIYRGMVYWAHGSLFMQADMPRAQDIDYVFTRSNVIDGEFVYGGAERSTHYSRSLVSYDNPANNYDTDVIPVTDNALQRRYRDRPIELSAIGCTRASEAQRRGKWALLSNSQDRTVTFKTGMEGRIPLPGFVIPVADELVAGRPNGGRISSAAGRVVTLDRNTPIKAGDRLIVNLPNGTAQARTVHSVAGRAVTVTTEYSLQPEPELQWAIDYDDLAVQLFRVLKTTRTQEGNYEITALEFNPSKFAAIDTGAKLDERPISVIPVTTVAPPASVSLSSGHMIDQGIAVSTMTIAWPAVAGAVAYDVEWRKDNGNWVRLQRTGAASVDVVGIYAGAYLARVRSVSAFDITSIWKSSDLTQLNGKEGLPPAVTFLTTESLLFGIGIKWGLPAGAEDTERTELWYSEGTDLGAATKLADLAYPQSEHVMQGLRAGQRFFFWARLVDRSGNVGPFFPVAPTVVTGIASADAGPILEQIKDQITESELGKELTGRIDLIDKNGPGSVNERVGAAKTELAKQVGEVNNALNTVKGNLEQQITAVSADVSASKTELQQQIANISALAGSLPYRKDKAYSVGQSALGSDGKLYQALKAVPLNTPPPNATYWTDVGQAAVTASGMAARVSKVETDVSTLDGKVTAQASQISGLQSSLTTTNGNVSAAQQAAQDAATLAGGKGKVIVQSAAPAVADRLAQNLWIDTTGNANTPKRWSGSAWVAVTDKVATDAAAAAQSALSQVALKADASVVSNLSTRVSDAEGKLTSQATRMDGMQTSIDGKASSQALQQVTSRVTATEDKDKAQDQLISSQSQALISLTDNVSKKADASTVQALSNEVKTQGQSLTAQGQALTRIDTNLGRLGASGVNLVPADFSVFTKDLPAGIYSNGGVALSTVTDASCFKGYALKADNSNENSHTFGLATAFTAAACNMGFKRGKYLVSFRARAQTADHVVGCYARVLLADGVSFKTSSAPLFTLTTAWARYSALIDLTAADYDGTQMQLAIQTNRSGVPNRTTYFDQFMFEAVVNDQAEPSIFNLGDSFEQAATNAAATTALSARVEKTEQGQTSTSQQVTQLENTVRSLDSKVGGKADAAALQVLANTVDQHGKSITANSQSLTKVNASLSGLGASGVNLVPAEYCAFTKDLPANMYSNGGVAMSTVPDAAAFKGYALRANNSNPDSHTFGLSTGFNAASCNMGFKPGKYLVSFYARSEVAGHIVGIYARVLLADGSSFKTSNAPTFALTTAWVRYVGVIDLTDPAYTGAQMQLAVQSNRSGVANRVTYYDRFMLEAVVNDQTEPSNFSMGNSFDQAAVLAEATTALSGRVVKNEEGLTSASAQLTQLKNSIGGSGVNLLPAEYSTFQKTLPVLDGSSFVASVENDSASFSGGTLKFAWATDSTGLSAFLSPKWNIGNMGMKPQKYIISYRARASADGHVVALYLRGINPDGSVVNSPAATQQPLTTSWSRYSYVADLTGGGFTGDKMLLVVQMNRSGFAGRSVWFDQIMVEQVLGEGTAPSTFTPGNTADQSSASASAIESLNSAVSQQGKDLTSVTSRTTLLEGSVNSPSSGLNTKASTSALQTLTGRVSAAEGGLTAASSSITRIGSQIDAIGGAGSNLIPAEFTTFGSAAPSIYKLAAMQVTTEADSAAYSGYLLKAIVSGSAATGFMYLASAIADYNLRLKPGATYTFSVWAKGSAAHVVGVRLRFVNSSGSVTEAVVGTIAVTTTLARQSVVITAPTNLVSTCCLVLFTQNTAAVGTTWFDGFMLEAQVGASAEPSAFVPGPSNRQIAAQAIAVDALDTKVTQQGAKIESEAKRTDGLYVSVGDANAAIQNEASTRAGADVAMGKRVDGVQSSLGSTNAAVQQISTAQANLDGKVNATWSVKLGLTSGGSYYAAGFGLGLENQGGTFQSSFVVLANRFSVLNPVGEGLVNIFTAENGQVVMNDALISKLTVQRAIVGSSINSSELANDGTPIMRMDFASGTLILLNKAATAYTVYNRRGIDMVINGVRRIRMGEWD
ncbi:DUF1983 domain-containing protein [Pseudomonas sp. SWI7]|uniref:phage tail protein n=1 Tax=Pseudomonas sp. SWI7 TaxID=2587597 RepID=UPI00112390E2|nr:DUF1983 domain-containing protein [Pseudomonas sp. SWI7]